MRYLLVPILGITTLDVFKLNLYVASETGSDEPFALFKQPTGEQQ